MRRIILMLSTAAVLAAMIAVASASPVTAKKGAATGGVHFTQGGTPTCTITGDDPTASCTSELTGLGNTDITARVSLGGEAVYTCQNKGGNQAPGQNRVLVGPAVDDATIRGSEDINGRVSIPVGPTPALTAPDTVSGKAAGCPNGNWTGVNPTLTTTGITYTASQGGSELFTCTREEENLSGTIAFTDAECSGVARFL